MQKVFISIRSQLYKKGQICDFFKGDLSSSPPSLLLQARCNHRQHVSGWRKVCDSIDVLTPQNVLDYNNLTKRKKIHGLVWNISKEQDHIAGQRASHSVPQALSSPRLALPPLSWLLYRLSSMWSATTITITTTTITTTMTTTIMTTTWT